ncbi:hypothetical protein BVX97_01455 [bacterium E08(2017)]|nr:hypothetical protein BVX97_01455 [bacterium E08(2017)]
MRSALVALSISLLTAAFPVRAEDWIVYEDCKLIPSEYFDGDSFHVKTKSYRYIFRLYYVDTPELNRDVPERISDQAEYFGVSEERILEVAEEAREFTRKFLSGGFAVFTRKQDAWGKSSKKRYFAMIKAGDKYLSEALIENGLARLYGYRVDLPNGKRWKKYLADLKVAEKAAKRSNKGGWAPVPEQSTVRGK